MLWILHLNSPFAVPLRMLEETYQYSVVATSKSSMFTISEQAFAERFRMMPDIKKKMIQNFKDWSDAVDHPSR